MNNFPKQTYYKDWIFWTLCVIVALLFFFAANAGHSQTNEPAGPVATELTPQAVAQSFTAWNAVALLIGGVIWHMILKVAPWAEAQGGLFKGVIRFFWDWEEPVKMEITHTFEPPKPVAPVNTAPPELAPTSMK